MHFLTTDYTDITDEIRVVYALPIDRSSCDCDSGHAAEMDRMGIEPNSPTLQKSVASPGHAGPYLMRN
jgi:hypothetical protein